MQILFYGDKDVLGLSSSRYISVSSVYYLSTYQFDWKNQNSVLSQTTSSSLVANVLSF